MRLGYLQLLPTGLEQADLPAPSDSDCEAKALPRFTSQQRLVALITCFTFRLKYLELPNVLRSTDFIYFSDIQFVLQLHGSSVLKRRIELTKSCRICGNFDLCSVAWID